MGVSSYAAEIADATEGLSPGDLQSVVMRATNIASFEGRETPVTEEHINEALRAVHEDRIMAQTGSMGPPPGSSRMPAAAPAVAQPSVREVGHEIAEAILTALRVEIPD
jgi:hypothetical protein